LAKELSDIFFLYSDGSTFVSSQEQLIRAAERADGLVRTAIKLARFTLGGIAVFFTMKSGATIIFNADEETVEKEKAVFMYGFAGFILIMVSEALIDVVFGIPSTLPPVTFGEVFVRPAVDVAGGISLITNVTNLLLAGVGGLFLFTLVAGGALYAFSAGNEERGQQATKVIIGSLLGLLIAFSSYTIVYEFSSGGRELQRRSIGPTQLSPAPIPAPVPVDPSLPRGPALTP